MTDTLTYTPQDNECAACMPPSKSIAARLLSVALLAGADPASLLPSDQPLCQDIQVMLDAVRALRSSPRRVDIDLCESGTARNIITALCAVSPSLSATLHMHPSLARRPFGSLLSLLRIYTDSDITVSDDKIKIKGGKIHGLSLPLRADTTRSSQAVTALSLIAPLASDDIHLCLPANTVSLPYIHMTIELMRRCGINTDFAPPYTDLIIHPGRYTAPRSDMSEADWSAAAFFYEMALFTGKPLTLCGLCAPADSLQGDACIADIFSRIGVVTQPVRDGVRLIPVPPAQSRLDINLRHAPDLVPPLVIACALKGIPVLIRGVSHLRYKESDRLEALRTILAAFSIEATLQADSIEIPASTHFKTPHAPIPTFADHRLAMALGPATALCGTLQIQDMQSVNKSFPTYWSQLERMGVRRS